MRLDPRLRRSIPLAIAMLLFATASSSRAQVGAGETRRTTGQQGFTLEQVRSYPFAGELVAARRAPRLAWAFNEQGRRNIWVGEAPSYEARQLTHFDRDDGQELSSVTISADGRYVVFVRGGDHDCNWDCTVPVNPTSSPIAPVVSVWIAPFDGSAPRAIGDGDTPAISPTGDVVAYVRDRQIWVAPLDGSAAPRRLFAARGELREPAWSPDGRKLAFVADRGDHAFIGVYENDSTAIQWLAPTTSRDLMPRWSPDGKRIAFVRRPGLGGPPDSILTLPLQPWKIVVADVETGAGRVVWKSANTVRGGYPRSFGANLMYGAGGRIAYLSYEDGWPHLYSVSDAGGAPLLLTPGDYMVETVRPSPDGRFLVYSANAGTGGDDIDRRHLGRVSIDRSDARVLTPGTGLEFSPVVTSDGATIAFLGATALQPAMPMVMPAGGGPSRSIAASRLPATFPRDQLVLEITESIAVDIDPRHLERLVELRETGIRLAIDDFGTGYSSLSYLRTLPVDVLKVDRTFAGTTAGATDLVLMEAIVRLGDSLGIDVIAEGIEHGEQVESLVGLGCDRAQGYLFARPVPAADLPEVARTTSQSRSVH